MAWPVTVFELYVTVADPDPQIRGGGGHPDPEIRGGGPVSKIFFSALRASVWSKLKISWGAGPSPRSATVLLATSGRVKYYHIQPYSNQ